MKPKFNVGDIIVKNYIPKLRYNMDVYETWNRVEILRIEPNDWEGLYVVLTPTRGKGWIFFDEAHRDYELLKSKEPLTEEMLEAITSDF